MPDERSRFHRVTLGRLVEDQANAVLSGVTEVRLDLAAVHDARVAVRRLRSTLAVLGPLVGSVPRGLTQDLRWFGRRIGGTRDAEVVAARLESAVEAASDRAAAAVITAALIRWSAAAGETARLVLADQRTDHLLVGLVRLRTEAPAGGERDDEVRADALVVEALEALRTTLPAAVSAGSLPLLTPGRRARLLHDQRKQVKTVRAVTSLLECTAEDRSRLNKSLRQVQELLGEHHDAVMTRSWLADVAENDPTARTLVKEIRRRERAEMVVVEEQLPWAVDRLVERVERVRRSTARSAR